MALGAIGVLFVSLCSQSPPMDETFCRTDIRGTEEFLSLARRISAPETGEDAWALLGLLVLESAPDLPRIVFVMPPPQGVPAAAGGFGHEAALRVCSPALLVPPLRRAERFIIFWLPDRETYLVSFRNLAAFEEVREGLAEVQEHFLAGELTYWALTEREIEEAALFPPGTIPVQVGPVGGDRRFIPYAIGRNCGRLRFLSPSEWSEAHREGRLTRQDILVLQEIPADFDVQVAGVVSASPQTPLSHANIIALQEGTPNAYIAGAWELFRALAGELVYYEVTPQGYELRPSDLREAERLWKAMRPAPLVIAPADFSKQELPSLHDLAGTYRPDLVGGKAAYLAKFLPAIPPENRVPGFAIPFAYLRRCLAETRLGRRTLAEDLTLMTQMPRFQTDSVYRSGLLEQFREALEETGRIPEGLVSRIARRIEEVFGSAGVKVRFRSSSNAEDALLFPAAGLYRSTSVCALDSLDADLSGPCACDPAEPKERTIERGLRKVWASQWNFQAFELRSWYGLPEDDVGMAVLVTPAFLNQAANGVALTGNPVDPDDNRYQVTVQPGEASVVLPEPGEVPELDLVAIESDGTVSVTRARASSLSPERPVMSEEELGQLARILSSLNSAWDPPPPFFPDLVRLNIEFKVSPERRLFIKQVRPFVIPGSRRVIEALVPTEAVFPPVAYVNVASGRDSAWTELANRLVIHLANNRICLPCGPERRSVPWIDRVEVGEKRLTLRPEEDASVGLSLGLDEWTRGYTQMTWRILQKIPWGEGTELQVTAQPLTKKVPLWAAGGREAVHTAQDLVVHLPEGLTEKLVPVGVASRPVDELALELADGDRIRVYSIRSGEGNVVEGSVLLAARGKIHGQDFAVDDPRELSVGFGPPPTRESYLVVLEDRGEDRRVLQIRFVTGRSQPSVELLRNLIHVEELPVSAWSRSVFSSPGNVRFLRGDADGDGSVGFPDAIKLLEAVFLGVSDLECEDAADVNDDGRVTVSDAVMILRTLFVNPTHGVSCELDVTADNLSRCEYEIWRCLAR